MSDRFSDSEASREALSALADGQAQPGEVARACSAWKDDPEARASWHTYQFIGDVMRSEDLAQASPSSVFLSKFRERLAQEPVVLVPAAAAAQRAAAVSAAASATSARPGSMAQPVALKRRTWLGPVGVAAGFVMVVGALLSSIGIPQGPSGSGGDLSLAQQAPGSMSMPDLSLAVAPVQQGVNAFVPMNEAMRTPAVATSGPSFSRPENVYVIVVRDPRIEHVMSAASQVTPAGEVSFAQGVQAQPVVFTAR